MAELDADHTRARCACGGREVELIADIADEVVERIEAVQQRYRLCRLPAGAGRDAGTGIGQWQYGDSVGEGAGLEVDDQVTAIVGDGAVRHPMRIVGDLEDEPIARLWIAEAMKIDHGLTLIVSATVGPQRIATVI